MSKLSELFLKQTQEKSDKKENNLFNKKEEEGPRKEEKHLVEEEKDKLMETDLTVEMKEERRTSIKIFYWSLDVLDTGFVYDRTFTAIQCILQTNPEIVFLYEIVPRTFNMLEKLLLKYYKFFFQKCPNYYLILIKRKGSIQTKEPLKVVQFENTKMDRKLLSLLVDIEGVPVLLMSSQLEYFQEGSTRRMLQIKSVFEKMINSPHRSIYVGDMNVLYSKLRESNVVPEKIIDAARLLTDDHKMPPQDVEKVNLSEFIHQPMGLLFDKMYICTTNDDLIPTRFEVFITNIDKCFGVDPTDHFGIVGSFKIYIK